MIRRLRLVVVLTYLSIPAHAQQYDLLIKGGHVVDSKNQINAVMDVAIAGRQYCTGRSKHSSIPGTNCG